MKIRIITTNLYIFIVYMFVYLPLEYEDVRVQSELDAGDLFASFFVVGVLKVESHESVTAHPISAHNLVL